MSVDAAQHEPGPNDQHARLGGVRAGQEREARVGGEWDTPSLSAPLAFAHCATVSASEIGCMSAIRKENSARRRWEAVRAQTHSHTGRVCIVICEHRGGMAATVPTQDLPPAGGFEPIRYKRNLPQRGPPGFIFFLVGGTAIIYGLYKVGEGNHKNWYVLQLKNGNRRRCEERKPETRSSWKRSFSWCAGLFFLGRPSSRRLLQISGGPSSVSFRAPTHFRELNCAFCSECASSLFTLPFCTG